MEGGGCCCSCSGWFSIGGWGEAGCERGFAAAAAVVVGEVERRRLQERRRDGRSESSRSKASHGSTSIFECLTWRETLNRAKGKRMERSSGRVLCNPNRSVLKRDFVKTFGSYSLIGISVPSFKISNPISNKDNNKSDLSNIC